MPKVASIFDAVGVVLTIALATAILQRGSAAADLIRAVGSSFSGLIDAAQN